MKDNLIFIFVICNFYINIYDDIIFFIDGKLDVLFC